MIIASIFATFLIILSIAMLRWHPRQHEKTHSFSIVVAIRNEVDLIRDFMESLHRIDYPIDKYEIILVDDASIDNTSNVIKDYIEDKPQFKLIVLEEKSTEYLGKKAALKAGVESSNNEILLFTDADTTVPSKWLSSMNSFYTPETGFVIGYVRKRFIPAMARFKRLMSVGNFASTAGLGLPFSCSGGNLSIRKETFDEIGGYETIKHEVAGDDKLLLKLVNKTKWKVAYNSEIKVLENNRQESLSSTINREKRQMGKFRMSSPLYMFLSLLILVFFIWLPINVIVTKSLLPLLPYALGMLSFYVASCFKHHEELKPVDLLFIFILPYYMLFFSIWGALSGFKWKN